MKSRFFTDEQGLDTTPDMPGKVCVCLLLDRRTLGPLLRQAQLMGISSGQYIDHLVAAAACADISVRGATAPSASYTP